jgi:hypothetical protein
VVLAEIQAGEGLSLSAAGRLAGPGRRGGKAVDASTVYRWVVRGSKSPSGDVIRLEGARVGGCWLTSRGALARFVAALTPVSGEGAPPPRSPAERRQADAAAAAELDRIGC